ncbi:tRNA (guanine-N(1)-)-methyltransferase [Alkalidesulfovibrio alkalitolerans DSM 16529]|uniref:tRNA (guanine-N(1)-)-methyltransferase n=1 Tax=Alkalidesulfovibrio alkalitolerans DSM 16529 TaxID=1121439 RepID=S7UL54_9BACT|nr:tRNA (guanosine(37)-N1)-methyltransferase TrmD [Alkalidesulfovibrio alkalitolerans]EPR33063.1 tRNA (guanine-N(1)-)-methyltransferase [Alkalidesulfovibrio alkalitolerans DSM 16529]
MRITILSLFPEFFDSPLSCGLMAKARARGVLDVRVENPRDRATDKHRTVDDTPYGGGPGMVMQVDPLARTLDSLAKPGRILLLSPKGRPMSQELARELASEEALTLVCGRYEGIDARFEELYPVTSVSVGDFVLNGGEAGALCLVEAVARLLPDFMGKQASGDEESFSRGLLEYPHYTRPEEYRGLRVPAVLLSGDHARIAAWRREQSLTTTLAARPELLAEAGVEASDLDFLRDLPRRALGRNLCVALVHHPVLTGERKVGTTSLTNLDLHDICRVSRSYGVRAVYATTPLADQRALAESLAAHWVAGEGGRGNPDRSEALRLLRVVPDLAAVRAEMAEAFGRPPLVVATSAKGAGTVTPGRIAGRLARQPVLLVFGTGHGLAPEVLREADETLRPIRPFADYNHLPVRAAVAVTLDRLLADHG